MQFINTSFEKNIAVNSSGGAFIFTQSGGTMSF
jgi:hypothetical protein